MLYNKLNETHEAAKSAESFLNILSVFVVIPNASQWLLILNT